MEFNADKPRGKPNDSNPGQKKGHWTYNDELCGKQLDCFLINLFVEFVWREHDNAHSLVDLTSNVNPLQNVQNLNHLNSTDKNEQETAAEKPTGNEQPLSNTIGGYTWDSLRDVIRDPDFKFNEFFVRQHLFSSNPVILGPFA